MKHLAVIYFMVCAFGLFAEDRKEPSSILHLCEKGVDHYASGTLDSAVQVFLRAEFLAFELLEPMQKAFSLETIGRYYQQLEFRSQALGVYESALSIRETIGDTVNVINLLDNMAGIHFEFQEFERAVHYWERAKPLLEQRRGHAQLRAIQEKIDSCFQLQQLGAPEDMMLGSPYSKAMKQQEIDHLFEMALLKMDLEEEKRNLQFALELKKEKALLHTILFLLVLAALLLISLFIIFQMKQRANQALSRLNHEISRQKELLESQNDKLEELDRMKSYFFTNISHEFRTPLTIIEGAVHEMRHSNGPAEKALEVIARNNNNLLLLVNQILDLRKLEAGKMKLELIQGDLISYLNYILESFYTLAASQNKKLHFLGHESYFVMDYDPEKLLQIVSNLLSNALKYTPEGKDIYVIVQRESREKELLSLTVRDTGVGIPKDQLPFIFDRFYQLDDWIYRREESTGIGLALTRELVELMNGAIEVQSVVGQGTSFFVHLPVTNHAPIQADNNLPQSILFQMEEADPEEELINDAEREGLPYLLLIEDNPDVVRYTTSLLSDHYRMEVARDGEKGLQLALDTIPDLIISDLKMPRKNGFEVCHTLKTDNRTSHIPIVLVSAIADQEARNDGLRGGADAYLVKPFNREELFIRLEQLIELRRRLQERYQNLSLVSPSDDPIFQKEDAFIAKLQTAIEEHLDDENFGIQELCKALGMSRSQLHLKIKALTDRSTSHYIRGFRLMRAREMFHTTNLNVTEVAFEVGFRDVAYFSRSFSAEFGLSPRDYLKTVS